MKAIQNKRATIAKKREGWQVNLFESAGRPENYQGGPSLKNVSCPLDGNWIVRRPFEATGELVSKTQFTGGFRLVVAYKDSCDAQEGQVRERNDDDWTKLRLGKT